MVSHQHPPDPEDPASEDLSFLIFQMRQVSAALNSARPVDSFVYSLCYLFVSLYSLAALTQVPALLRSFKVQSVDSCLLTCMMSFTCAKEDLPLSDLGISNYSCYFKTNRVLIQHYIVDKTFKQIKSLYDLGHENCLSCILSRSEASSGIERIYFKLCDYQ